MWQCVCCSYCCQLNAVSFSTDTSWCTVQIHIQCADWVLFRYTAGIFSVLLWIFQCVCCSYCCQLNAVNFSTDTSWCTVQIHIHSADCVLFRYTAGIFSVFLWMWQCVCWCYCCQLNAVSFSTDTSCCTVQIHIQRADWALFRYTAGMFSVLLWMWQCVCCSYCRQLNAVNFSTDTSCCTVQIHIQCADWVLFRYTAGIFSMLLWMWQCVCCSYCSQLNAVSFSTDT